MNLISKRLILSSIIKTQYIQCLNFSYIPTTAKKKKTKKTFSSKYFFLRSANRL